MWGLAPQCPGLTPEGTVLLMTLHTRLVLGMHNARWVPIPNCPDPTSIPGCPTIPLTGLTYRLARRGQSLLATQHL